MKTPMDTIQRLLTEFIKTALEQKQSHNSGEWRREKKSTTHLYKLFQDIISLDERGKSAFLSLLSHEHPNVRVNAALYSLNYDAKETLPVLLELAKRDDRIGSNAQQILWNWKQSNWQIEASANTKITSPPMLPPWEQTNDAFVIEADRGFTVLTEQEESVRLVESLQPGKKQLSISFGDLNALTLNDLLLNPPKELALRQFHDQNGVVERAAEVDVISGQNIDFYGDGLIGFHSSENPPYLNHALAWAYIIRPDLSREIALLANDDLRKIVCSYIENQSRA